MTQHQLSIRAQFRPEVLERVLRVVRLQLNLGLT